MRAHAFLRRNGLWLLVLAGTCRAGLSPAGASSGGAHPVEVTENGTRVSLNNGALVLQFELAPEGAVLLQSLKLPDSDHDWAMKGSPAGINLKSDGINLTGFSAGKGFQHAGHSHQARLDGGTELQLRLEHKRAKLIATLIITAYPNSPVVDLCLRLQNNGGAPLRNLARFDPLSVALPVQAQPYRAYWVTRKAYALHQVEVKDSLTVDGGNWNGPEAAGWFALEDPAQSQFLVAGIEWERHFAFDLQGEAGGKILRLSSGLRRACTQDLAPGGSLESPHVFLGLAAGNLDDAANTTHDFLRAHVLPPSLAGFPFVCYDIWSTEGTNVEARILDEARFAAEKLGVEVFYHDAAWYRDSDTLNKERWGVGLGNYTDDRRKLPQGLRHLSDAVHGLGMKFGLWVCPEMLDVTVMEREQLPDRWVATANGQPNATKIGGWHPMKMVCLGDPEVEQFVQQHLLRAVEDFKLDWLKWDASGEPSLDVVCDRADHGHQAGNGSQAAAAAKYRVLDAVFKQHPNLILEECSYGSRMDYGMARTARVNWLSDSTAPSSHVRDNVMAAAYVLPSACNMAWVMRDDEIANPQSDAFLDTLFRSRMMGSFGFGTMHGSLSECVSLYPPGVIEATVRNVKAYKSYRHLLMEHVYHLTPWGKPKAWQVMEFAPPDRREAVVFFFRNGSQETNGQVQLRSLDPDGEYELVRLNTGSKIELPGARLMQSGAEADLSQDPQASEILHLKIVKKSQTRER